MATVIAGISGTIGAALAEHYLDAGEQVIIGLARNPEQVPQVLRANPRVRLIAWTAEGEPDSAFRERLADSLVEVEALDNLIYAAGLLHDDSMFPEKRLEELEEDNLLRAFQVNALGFVVLVRELMPWLRGPQLKRVVAISAKVGSISDNRLGGWYAYRCSKAALNMLVKNLSVELPRRYSPIACVALHPGTTQSPLSEPFRQSLSKLIVHEPIDTAGNLYRVITSLSDADNGRFISWDGSDLPW